MTSTRISELEFLRKLQRLLSEGDFSSTLKFALLNALADLCVERPAPRDGSLRLPLNAIAAHFIEYYWRQALPYRAPGGAARELLQNAGKQIVAINAVHRLRSHSPTLAGVRRTKRYASELSLVADNIELMPLWKLQRIGNDVDEFLYRRAEFADGSIRLLPGVPAAFKSLHGLVVDVVRGAWVRRIGRISQNGPLLENADLEAFLFGTERSALADFAPILRDHQRGLCLYCARAVRDGWAVDHFIAWSRYPVDLGHNLVLAHASCNARKRDFLAFPGHVERWALSHLEQAEALTSRFDAARLPHDIARTRAVAWWAYEEGERAGAHAWIEKDRVVRLDAGWRGVLDLQGLLKVAESEYPDYRSVD